MLKTDQYYMNLALNEARKSLKYEDVPIGAIIVYNGKIIGRGHNQVEKKKDALAHAELIAIKNAIKKVGYKHLLGSKLYVTLEPCSMCSGAIVLARIQELIIGTDDPKAGGSGSVLNITNDIRLNHRCSITRNINQEECSKIIREFFSDLRKKKK